MITITNRILLVIAGFFATGCMSLETTTFTTKGCCPTCEIAILDAVDLDEVKNASWDQFEETITIKFQTKQITSENLQLIVASAGYDTDLFQTPDSIYFALPKCCQYRD